MTIIKESLEEVQKLIRVFSKSLAFFLLVIFFLIATYLVDIIVTNKKNKLNYSSRLTSFFAGLCLFVLRIKVSTNDPHGILSNSQSGLLISNHLSYIDIFVISSITPSIFVAGVDSVEEKFLLGTVTRLSGGIFVIRKNRTRVDSDLKSISEVLNMGFKVVLFPEGTTSNGDSILPFKSSFFSAAEQTQSSILPICIKYKEVNDQPITNSNRDLIYYYEQEVDFFKHFFRMLTTHSINVEVNFLNKIVLDSKTDRKKLSQKTYESILSVYKNIV